MAGTDHYLEVDKLHLVSCSDISPVKTRITKDKNIGLCTNLLVVVKMIKNKHVPGKHQLKMQHSLFSCCRNLCNEQSFFEPVRMTES